MAGIDLCHSKGTVMQVKFSYWYKELIGGHLKSLLYEHIENISSMCGRKAYAQQTDRKPSDYYTATNSDKTTVHHIYSLRVTYAITPPSL